MINELTTAQAANLFDHTLLSPYAVPGDFKKLCAQAVKYGFKMVAVNACNIPLCKTFLEGSSVQAGAAISFPLGQCTLKTKLYEASDAIEIGADEIDYVINVGKLKNGELDYIELEMRQIVDICKSAGVISKVIFENCYLTKDEIKVMCQIASSVGPDFIKTSTGFGTGGATLEDVALMRQYADKSIRIKAAGGIRTLETVAQLVALGVERIGSSAGAAIIDDLKKLRGEI